MRKLIFLCGAVTLSCASYAKAIDVTLEMRKKSEEVISSCEKNYQNTKEQGKRLDNIKKSNFLSSKKSKEAYKNKEAYKAVFNLRLAEFTKFTNDKIKIRAAKEASKFRDEVNAYSSNCSRFAGGLVEFVDWAITGKVTNKISETIFKDWMKDAK